MSVGAIENVSAKQSLAEQTDGKETKDFYAWSIIDFGAEVSPEGFVTARQVVKYGDKVDKKTLGIPDEEWDKLVDERVIRKSVPPETKQYESPKRTLIANAKQSMDAALTGGE